MVTISEAQTVKSCIACLYSQKRSTSCLIVLLVHINLFLWFIKGFITWHKNSSPYASIMLNAFRDLLCSKLCWHNQRVPNSAGDVPFGIPQCILHGLTSVLLCVSFILLTVKSVNLVVACDGFLCMRNGNRLYFS